MPQLDPSSFGSQLFWLVICFVTLYLVMAVIVLPRISKTLAARADRLDEDLAEAEKLRHQAATALAAYEEALAQARTQALGLAQKIHAEVQVETDRRKAELDTKLAEQAAVADARLAQLRTAAMSGLRDAAQDIIGDVLSAIGSDMADDKSIGTALDAVAAE